MRERAQAIGGAGLQIGLGGFEHHIQQQERRAELGLLHLIVRHLLAEMVGIGAGIGGRGGIGFRRGARIGGGIARRGCVGARVGGLGLGRADLRGVMLCHRGMRTSARDLELGVDIRGDLGDAAGLVVVQCVGEHRDLARRLGERIRAVTTPARFGSLDAALPERATTTVTPRVREQVFARDQFLLHRSRLSIAAQPGY